MDFGAFHHEVSVYVICLWLMMFIKEWQAPIYVERMLFMLMGWQIFYSYFYFKSVNK